MRNVSVKEAARIAGDPYVELAATKGLADSIILPVLDEDWTTESLSCFVSFGPGFPALTTLQISLSSETNTWQHHVDCDGVRRQDVPCGVLLSDTVMTTLVNITWAANSFDAIPAPTIAGKPVTVYYEIRRVDQDGPNFIVGDITLTEKIS